MAKSRSSKSTPFLFRPSDELKKSKDAFDLGNPFGLVDAFYWCFDMEIALPEWVATGVAGIFEDYVVAAQTPKAKGATAKIKLRKRDGDDYKSYLAVCMAMLQKCKGEKKWERAQQLLAANGINRAISTIEDAYDEVRSALKNAEGQARYRRFVTRLGTPLAQTGLKKGG